MAREVTWDGRKFPSIAAAARHEGVPYSRMRDWLQLPPEQIPRPVTIRGVTYPSLKAAAEALGVTKETVRQARFRGTLDKIGKRKAKR